MLKWLLVIVVAVIAALVLAFGYLNTEPVQLDLYFRSLELPISLAVVAAFAIGVLISVIVYLPRVFLRNRKIARLERRLRQSTEELAELRRVPMKDVE